MSTDEAAVQARAEQRYRQRSRKSELRETERAERELGASTWWDLGFFGYLSQCDIPVELIDPDARSEVGRDLYEAAREAGVEGLLDVCVRMLPALDAIRAMP